MGFPVKLEETETPNGSTGYQSILDTFDNRQESRRKVDQSECYGKGFPLLRRQWTLQNCVPSELNRVSGGVSRTT